MADHSKLFGYFDDDQQETPKDDPGLDVPCIICFDPLKDRPIKTISFMVDHPRVRSYFYRCHKGCYDLASPEDITAIESSVIDKDCGH